jgi:hypothetical protein
MNDNNKSELILNIDKLHTTDLGIEQIKRNLCLMWTILLVGVRKKLKNLIAI